MESFLPNYDLEFERCRARYLIGITEVEVLSLYRGQGEFDEAQSVGVPLISMAVLGFELQAAGDIKFGR